MGEEPGPLTSLAGGGSGEQRHFDSKTLKLDAEAQGQRGASVPALQEVGPPTEGLTIWYPLGGCRHHSIHSPVTLWSRICSNLTSERRSLPV
jgi:hypothetical protein